MIIPEETEAGQGFDVVGAGVGRVLPVGATDLVVCPGEWCGGALVAMWMVHGMDVGQSFLAGLAQVGRHSVEQH